MSDKLDTTQELLVELLNETREIRRLLARQCQSLESLECHTRENSPPEVAERVAAARQEQWDHFRVRHERIDPAQQPLVDKLEKRGLAFKNFGADDLPSGPADEIAESLAENYDLVASFLKALVHAHGTKTGFSHSTKNLSTTALAATIRLARTLEHYGMVRTMNLTKHQIHIEPLCGERIELFLSGGWLERVVHNLITRLRPDAWCSQKILANIRCRNTAGETFEFDLLVPISEGKFVCLDSKTGSLAQSKGTIARNSHVLGLPRKYNFVVVPFLDPNKITAWQKSLTCATVIPYAALEKTLITLS